MTEGEVSLLRYRSKAGNVFWKSGSEFLNVKSVPVDMRDPDDTGIPDFIAYLESKTGSTVHVDLGDVPLSDFYVMRPLSEGDNSGVLKETITFSEFLTQMNQHGLNVAAGARRFYNEIVIRKTPIGIASGNEFVLVSFANGVLMFDKDDKAVSYGPA